MTLSEQFGWVLLVGSVCALAGCTTEEPVTFRLQARTPEPVRVIPHADEPAPGDGSSLPCPLRKGCFARCRIPTRGNVIIVK